MSEDVHTEEERRELIVKIISAMRDLTEEETMEIAEHISRLAHGGH